MGGDQEEMNEGPGALGEEIDKSSLDRQQGGENDSQQNHQDCDVWSLHKSEALTMVAIAVESNLTTMDPWTDQAAAGVVSVFNVGKWLKSYSPWKLSWICHLLQDQRTDPSVLANHCYR